MIQSISPTTRDLDHNNEESKWWTETHEEQVLGCKNNPNAEIIFIGDSITQQWNERKAWENFSDKSINLGIGGDQTQHVLWRLENNQQLQKLNPKTIVLLIGTNNIGWDQKKPNIIEETALGIEACVKKITSLFPDSKLILLSILPREQRPDEELREMTKQANEIIATKTFSSNTHLHNIENAFIEENGYISEEVMHDYLHLTEKGYHIFAEELLKII